MRMARPKELIYLSRIHTFACNLTALVNTNLDHSPIPLMPSKDAHHMTLRDRSDSHTRVPHVPPTNKSLRDDVLYRRQVG